MTKVYPFQYGAPQKAQALQEEFEATTDFRPKYPRSWAALQDLRETLDAMAWAKLKANDAWRQGAEDFAGEFARSLPSMMSNRVR